MSTFNTKYMFAHNYAAIAHTVPSITFKPNMGYLLEVVESTTDQVVLNDDEAGVVGSIPVNTPVHTETVVLPSAGEKVYSEETDITDEFVPTTSVESYQTNVPYMDDFLGENEGEEDEQDKNASEVESSTEQFILDVCKLSNDSVNTSNKEVITHTASVIARNIGQVYTNLTNELSPEVDELVKQVQLEAESINQLSGTDQLATYLNIDNTKITPINWNELSVLGTPNTIIDNSKRFSGYTGSNLLTFNAAKAIVTKWSNQIPSTTISKEVRDNIINMIACTLDGKKVPYLYDETDNQQIPDTIEELDTISDNSETAAEESFKNFYDSYTRNGIAQEGMLSDLKTKLKDLFTSTDTFVDQIKKVNLSKYSRVKPEDLPNNKVVLLNKKFASELYTILNRNYMQVDKVVKLLLDTPVAATRAQLDTIISMCNKLAKDLPGYSRESSNIKQLLKTNSSEKAVKDSDWKLGDIRIMDKIEELSNRYKTIEDKASSDAMWDRFSGMDATDDLINCGFVIEYYMYYTAVLRSQLAKTCIRIVRAYDKALESSTSGTENLDLVSGEEGFSDILRKIKSFFGGIETKYNQVKKLDFDKYADIKIKDLPGKGVQIDLNLMKNVIKFYNSHPFDPQILNNDYKKLHEDPEKIIQKYTKQYIEPLMKVFSISSFDIKHTNPGKFKKLNIQSDVYENNKYTVRDLISVIKELDVLFELFVTKCTTIINSLPHKSDYDLGILVWIFVFWPAAIPLIIARSHAEDDINVVNASKQIASAMNSYFKFGVAAFAGILDMSDDIYSKLAKVKATESLVNGTEGTERLTHGLIIGREDISGQIKKKFIDITSQISNKYKKFKSIDVNKLPDSITVKKGIDIKIFKNLIAFIKSNEFNLQDMAKEVSDLVQNSNKGDNAVIDVFVNKYKPIIEKAANSLSISVESLCDTSSKNLVAVGNQTYSKVDIKYIYDNIDVLKNVFDGYTENIISRSKSEVLIIFFALFISGIIGAVVTSNPGALISSLIMLFGLPSSFDKDSNAKKVKEIMNAVYGFIKASNVILMTTCAEITSAINGIDKSTEELSIKNTNLIVYNDMLDLVLARENLFVMDDLLGEHEGEDNEQEKNASEVSASVASEVYNIVATSIGYERFVKYLNHVIQGRDTGKQVQPLMDIVTKYPKVLDLYRTMDLNISHTDNEIIRKNTETVMDVLNTVGLYLLTCRKYFKDNNVLVLDANHVNSDTLVDFEKQGGSMEDISRHILHKYTLMNTSLPFVGLRTSEVLSNKQAVASEHFRRCDATKKSIELKEGGALVLAYTKVLSKYLEMTPSNKLPIGMSMNNFITNNKVIITRTSNHLRDSKMSVDSCIYRFMLDLWYHDKPIYKQMYNKFENKYRQLFNSSMGDITPEQKLQADAEVLSDTVLEFLMDNLVTSK